MIALNIITCAGIAIALAWIMRQILHAPGQLALWARLSIAMLAAPYALKILERLHGDTPTVIDIIRDLGLLILLVVVILFHRDRFGRL